MDEREGTVTIPLNEYFRLIEFEKNIDKIAFYPYHGDNFGQGFITKDEAIIKIKEKMFQNVKNYINELRKKDNEIFHLKKQLGIKEPSEVESFLDRLGFKGKTK